MRFLVAAPGPSFSVQDVYIGWCEGLRALGHTVVPFNLDARLSFFASAEFDYEGERRKLPDESAMQFAADSLCATLWKVRPDVLLVVSGFYVPPAIYDMARGAYGTRVVIVHTESPYEDDRQLRLASHVDINLLNDPTNIDAFSAVSRAEYMPHAYRPSLHHPGEPKPDLVCDLGFVGTAYPSRVAFFEAMNLSGLDVVLGGNWAGLSVDSKLRPAVGHDLDSCLDNAEAADLYRSARCGINLYRRETTDGGRADGWAIGPREVEMAACGLFYLRESRGEGDDLLPTLPTFATPEDASEQLRWWLAHDRLREDAAEAARLAVADRTFENNARALTRIIEKGVS